MRIYDLVLVIKSSLSEAQRKKLVETIKSWLKEAKITKEEEWGQKVLSYKIKKESAGFYFLYSLEMDNIPSDFEKKLLGNEGVLRHLLIRRR